MKALQDELNDLEIERQELLKPIHESYYDRNSPHYYDNDRFSWAIAIVNKNFDRKANKLRESYLDTHHSPTA